MSEVDTTLNTIEPNLIEKYGAKVKNEAVFSIELRDDGDSPEFAEATLDSLVEGRTFNVGLLEAFTSGNLPIHERIQLALIDGIKSARYDIIVAPEYSFVKSKRVEFSESEKDEIVHNIAESSAGQKSLIVPGTILWQKDGRLLNTAYAICDGKILCAYDKMRNGGEFEIAHRCGLSFQPGLKPGLFSWGDLKVGLEICADVGVLARHNVSDLDLQVFVSCGLTRTKTCGKYLIINDGWYKFVAVCEFGSEIPIKKRVGETK